MTRRARGDGIRCLVWDLDNTLWSGTVLEQDRCRLRPGVRHVIEELDRRGILLSIASANDPELALATLRRKGLEEYFVHPQIGWNNKVRSIHAIADKLGLALQTFGFIDDEPFEREQVQHMLPEVRTYPAMSCSTLLDRPEMSPRMLTKESRARRLAYQHSAAREAAEGTSRMTRDQFLSYCRTRLTIRAGVRDDLDRITELMRRTHQLNSSGTVHRAEQIVGWMEHPGWHVYVAELADRFVDYGRVGVAIARGERGYWELRTFLLSCRVLARGITGYFHAWVVGEAQAAGATSFRCRYRPSARNTRLATLYKLAGFHPVSQHRNGTIIYEKKPVRAPEPPKWLAVFGETES